MALWFCIVWIHYQFNKHAHSILCGFRPTATWDHTHSVSRTTSLQLSMQAIHGNPFVQFPLAKNGSTCWSWCLGKWSTRTFWHFCAGRYRRKRWLADKRSVPVTWWLNDSFFSSAMEWAVSKKEEGGRSVRINLTIQKNMSRWLNWTN